jgi:ribonucleoside-diphosphate reductase alpha chain
MTSNAYENILPARYLKKDEDGNVIEEQEDLFARVAENVAVAEAVFNGDYDFDEKTAHEIKYDDVEGDGNVEKWADEFLDVMSNLKFIPNTPTLINAGREIQQLSACFVNSPEDSIESIGQTETEAKLIFQSGGGVGYDFGKLRPFGDTVGSTGGIASGPITFMQDYDQSCETIAQGGVRRGAQMGTMQVTHPDVIHFIHAKNKDISLAHCLRLNDPDDPTYTDFAEAIEEARELIDDEGRVPKHLRNAVEGHLSNFNISVTITDEFMQAVENGEYYTLINPRTDEPHIATEETKEMYEWFDLGHEVTVGEELRLPAEEIWERIVEGAWNNGEPGVMFIDEVNREHSYDVEEHPEYEMTTSNPCCAEGTLVNTPEGYRPVEDISEGDRINTVYGSENVDEVLSFEERDIYKVEFSDGGIQYVTEDHRYHAIQQEGSYTKRIDDIPLRELNEGDKVRLMPNINGFPDGGNYDDGLKKGILLGDGCYTENTIGVQGDVSISTNIDVPEYNQNLKKLFETDRKIDKSGQNKGAKIWLSDGEEVVDELDLTPGKAHEKNFDIEDISGEKEAIGLLDGLLASDGNINLSSNHPQARWFTSSEELARNIRRVMISIGCHGQISVEEAYQKSNGTIDGREIKRNHDIYTVYLSGESLRRYLKKSNIEDVHPDKGERKFTIFEEFVCSGNGWRAKIDSIEYAGREDVYDLYCEGSDTWITDGYIQRGCAEQNLMEYEACNLGHINLSTIVDENVQHWGEFEVNQEKKLVSSKEIESFLEQAIDWDEFNHRIEVGTRFLDNVVTMSDFPIDKIEETVRKNRKIGLGIMGLAQLYIQLGVEYGSEEGNEIARQLMSYINHESKRVSHEIAEERGVFENWYDSKYADPYEYEDWMDKHVGENWRYIADEDGAVGYPIRNHNTTTIAPTGTTSMIGNTSGGCEPIFNVAYYKNVTDDIQGDEMLVEFDSLFLKTLEVNGIDVEAAKEEAEELMSSPDKSFDGPRSLESVPDEIANLFVTAGDIDSEAHASVMCALQEGVDSSISKTLNAPNDATVEEAKETFEYVYENGGKSVTFYRDGSRTKQVQTTRKENQESSDEESESVAELPPAEARLNRDAPKVASGIRYEIETGYGGMFVNIVEDEHGPVELIANVGKSGGTVQSMTEAIGRLVSKSLQNGVPPTEIVKQLENIHSPRKAWDGGEGVESVPDGIAVALKRHIESEMNHTTVVPTNHEEQSHEQEEEEEEVAGLECFECGSTNVQMDGSCPTCQDCGYSECG